MSLGAALTSRFAHVYWALGSNFSPTGNFRLGLGNFEFGLIQGSNVGVVYVQRTASALFVQLGPVTTSGGYGLIGGGGLEWDTSSFFRLRTDVTVSTDSSNQTQGYVSFGGVFIL